MVARDEGTENGELNGRELSWDGCVNVRDLGGLGKREALPILVVCGLDGSEHRAPRRLGHDMVDVMRPRDPVVPVRETPSLLIAEDR
jgi:hypothetical protein